MIWDKLATFYDLFENAYNGQVNKDLCVEVAEMIESRDKVLECACGTGMLTTGIAKNCKKLIATDYSEGMLKQARIKCAGIKNLMIAKASITELPFKDQRFDKVVAANVIHLLDDPGQALRELERVCKVGGKIIIPTYINDENEQEAGIAVKALTKLGIQFKRQFDLVGYMQFFLAEGYEDVDYTVIPGRMPCAIAVITKKEAEEDAVEM